MTGIAYTVSATFRDEQTRGEFIAWLQNGHVSDVVRGGASSGSVVLIREPAQRLGVECRYIFPSRDAYDRYLQDHAPALRAEGLAKFPPERGVTFARTVGEVVLG